MHTSQEVYGIDALASLKASNPDRFAAIAALVSELHAASAKEYRAAREAVVADDARARATETVKLTGTRGLSGIDNVPAHRAISYGLPNSYTVTHSHLTSPLANKTIEPFVRPIVGATDTTDDAEHIGGTAWAVIAELTSGTRYAATARDILTRAAIRKGRRSPDAHTHADVMQDARERAYSTMAEYATDGTVYPVAGSDYTDERGDIVHSVDGVIGWYVVRPVRCGDCESCRTFDATDKESATIAYGPAKSGSRGRIKPARAIGNVSRYVVKSCAAPRDITEYVTARRIVSRATYAAAAADLTREQYARSVEPSDLDDAATECITAEGETTTEAHERIRLVAQACALAGVKVSASGKSGVSLYAAQVLALSYGLAPTPDGRRNALAKLRAEAGTR